MKDWIDFKKELLQDPEIQQEYDALALEYSIIEQIIKKRLETGLTQQQLAEKIGTKQSAIARLESGSYNPSISLLKKIASALNTTLTITLK